MEATRTGWELTLDNGVVFAPALGITAFDFSTGPLTLALPTVLSTLDVGHFLIWTIPLYAVATFMTLGNTVTVTASGTLTVGEATIPEPGTLLLLGAGLTGLVMARRRRIEGDRDSKTREPTMQRKILGSVALGLTVALGHTGANAAPISFMVDPATRIGIEIATQTLGGSQGSAGADGTVDVDLTLGVLTTLHSGIAVEDITTTGSGLLGNLVIADVHAVLDDAGNPSVGSGDVYDLAGWELTLNQGVVYVPALLLTAFDFSTGPLALALPSALSTLDHSIPFDTWNIPVNAVVTFLTLGNTVTVTVSGALHLVEVPEPGTLLLLGAGLAGFVRARGRSAR